MTSPDRIIVTPTVGRKVWFRPNGSMQKMPCADGRVVLPEFCSIEQPMDATVIFVHGPRMVNLDITDHIGQRFVARSVTLLQDGDFIPDTGFYCEWMPYQTAQAKKEHVVRIEPESEKFGLVSIDSAIEQQIQAAGADKAPRVTPADIEAEIAAEYSTTLDKALAGCPLLEGMDRVTVSVIVLKNGTKLVGVNYGAIDPAQHSPEKGAKEARAAAIEQMWPLLGFRLRDELSRPVLTDADAAADLAGTPRP